MKSVLVTGGTLRIGSAISRRLASSGWRVIASSHRRPEALDNLEIIGGCDLSLDGAAESLYERASALAGGHLDAVVNNAAIFRGAASALARVNTEAPVRLMELALANGGSVVNILDTKVLASEDGTPAPCDGYLESKRKLLAATLRFAAMSSPRFRVNAVAPGPVLAPVGVHEKAGKILTERPSPDDVASAVAFLLDTPSVTGAVIPVDAGQHLTGC